MTYLEIGQVLDRSETSINDRIRKMDLLKTKKTIWSDEEIETLKAYYNLTPDVFDMFPGRTRQSIAYKAHSLGLKKNERGAFRVNYNFFSEWTEEMAYIFGLICADGNIGHPDNKVLVITLHKNDLYMLEQIKQIMKSERNIGERKSGCCDFIVRHHKIYDDLVKLGVVPQKSLTLKWVGDNIPSGYLRHFIRGYIDGDGCVSTYNRKRPNGYVEKILDVTVLGTVDFLSGASKAISDEIGIKEVAVSSIKNNKISKSRWSGSTAVKLLDWIYKDATIFLKRKKDKYDNYLLDICDKTKS